MPKDEGIGLHTVYYGSLVVFETVAGLASLTVQDPVFKYSLFMFIIIMTIPLISIA
jgi:hypothetical protein